MDSAFSTPLHNERKGNLDPKDSNKAKEGMFPLHGAEIGGLRENVAEQCAEIVTLVQNAIQSFDAYEGQAQRQVHDPKLEAQAAENSTQQIAKWAHEEIVAMWREVIRLGNSRCQEAGADSTSTVGGLNRARSMFRPFRKDAQAAEVWMRSFEGEVEGEIKSEFGGEYKSGCDAENPSQTVYDSDDTPLHGTLLEDFGVAQTWARRFGQSENGPR